MSSGLNSAIEKSAPGHNRPTHNQIHGTQNEAGYHNGITEVSQRYGAVEQSQCKRSEILREAGRAPSQQQRHLSPGFGNLAQAGEGRPVGS
jgi:hypothetical protein